MPRHPTHTHLVLYMCVAGSGSGGNAGDYVRQWLPQLRNLPREFIHCPWEAPATMLAAAGVSLGRQYPKRILIDLEAARRNSLAVRTSHPVRPHAPLCSDGCCALYIAGDLFTQEGSTSKRAFLMAYRLNVSKILLVPHPPPMADQFAASQAVVDMRLKQGAKYARSPRRPLVASPCLLRPRRVSPQLPLH